MQAQEQPGQFHMDEAAYRPAPAPPWWRAVLNLLSHPASPAVLAALMLFGLLFAFHQVVSGAVEQGQQRRMITAVQAQIEWRCRIRADSGHRAACAPTGEVPALKDGRGRDIAVLTTASQ